MSELIDTDEAIILVMSENDPPRSEGWTVPELAPVMTEAKFKRTHDTLRNRLRKLHHQHLLVAGERAPGVPGSPTAYSLTMKGWRLAGKLEAKRKKEAEAKALEQAKIDGEAGAEMTRAEVVEAILELES
jgi:hypothetical protein